MFSGLFSSIFGGGPPIIIGIVIDRGGEAELDGSTLKDTLGFLVGGGCCGVGGCMLLNIDSLPANPPVGFGLAASSVLLLFCSVVVVVVVVEGVGVVGELLLNTLIVLLVVTGFGLTGSSTFGWLNIANLEANGDFVVVC